MADLHTVADWFHINKFIMKTAKITCPLLVAVCAFVVFAFVPEVSLIYNYVLMLFVQLVCAIVLTNNSYLKGAYKRSDAFRKGQREKLLSSKKKEENATRNAYGVLIWGPIFGAIIYWIVIVTFGFGGMVLFGLFGFAEYYRSFLRGISYNNCFGVFIAPEYYSNAILAIGLLASAVVVGRVRVHIDHKKKNQGTKRSIEGGFW